jgi:hypothetical protein
LSPDFLWVTDFPNQAHNKINVANFIETKSVSADIFCQTLARNRLEKYFPHEMAMSFDQEYRANSCALREIPKQARGWHRPCLEVDARLDIDLFPSIRS